MNRIESAAWGESTGSSPAGRMGLRWRDSAGWHASAASGGRPAGTRGYSSGPEHALVGTTARSL
jgi:hypothetical protein